ncbi:hypothetical protein [Clostridium sp. YIM B02500]|uniref:hypothetical protein n=1 Tax=Clostridium sp. YIM B02500 TaxID=2910681 RepID=UPI001EEE11A6|nr:hypothetical protein [Clostridium sp. YIM B02500]
MSQSKIPFSINPGDDYPMEEYSKESSPKSKASDSENVGKTTDSSERNAKSLNNANISRTNLDTELIDLNADGDSDESKYSDLI